MNSLFKLGGLCRQAVIASIMICTLSLAVAAQTVPVQQQGRFYGEPGFRGEPINLNVVNADIRDILNYITEQYGINFVIDKSVAAVPVTVNISDVPWNIALDSILNAQGLGVQVNGSILRIANKTALAADLELDERARDSQVSTLPLYTEFIRLNYARAKGSIVRGTSTSGTRADPSLDGTNYFAPVAMGGGTGAGAGGGQTSGGEGLLPIIQRRLSRRGSIEVDERSNSLIITDVRQNLDTVIRLISILDQPEPQVEIEARIVVATRNFSRDLGSELSAIVTGPRGKSASFDTSLSASNPVNTVIGLTTGLFGTAKIDLFITAGERKGQAKIIATPRVTTLNLKKASIESGTKIPVTTIQPGVGGAGGTAIATTTYIDVPLKLEITPQITDVGTVVLDVVAENSSTAASAAGVAPAINNQIMKTQVTVPDGGTTVVGGVLFDDERENQSRTPGLWKIPILGYLFKRKNIERNTNEILFFITPRIYRPEAGTRPGSSGVVTSGTFIQPVPLGNPPSNSDQIPTQPVAVPSPAVPVKP